MVEFLADYGLFLAKTLTLVVGVLVIVAGIAAIAARHKPSEAGHIEVRKLNDRYRAMRSTLRAVALDSRAFKQEQRDEKKARRRRRKAAASAAVAPCIYVLTFRGDIRAHAVESLREEVSAVLANAVPGDAVVVRIESGGGLVHSYGLAAAQLARLREHGLLVTACVDRVAASGGYLMACVANRIVAAPFALLGSIGVVAQLPNFNRLLRRHDIDVELLTAGRYKRTLTLFGENTEEGRQKFAEELADIHALFKEYVQRYRPALDIESVATGEAWFGERALGKGLIDEIATSDEQLQKAADSADLIEVHYVERKPLVRRLGLALEGAFTRALENVLDRAAAPDERYR